MDEIRRTALKTVFATGVMTVVCLMMFAILEQAGTGAGRFVRLGLPLMVGAAGFLITARMIGLDEPWQLLAGRRSLTQDRTAHADNSSDAT